MGGVERSDVVQPSSISFILLFSSQSLSQVVCYGAIVILLTGTIDRAQV